MSGAGAVMGAVSNVMNFRSSAAESDYNYESEKNRARQLEQATDAEYAEGTRRASEINRQGEVFKSDARAQMAAGGGVTDDVGAIETLSDIDRVYDYNALSSIFEAEERAKTLSYASRTTRDASKMGRELGNHRASSTTYGS